MRSSADINQGNTPLRTRFYYNKISPIQDTGLQLGIIYYTGNYGCKMSDPSAEKLQPDLWTLSKDMVFLNICYEKKFKIEHCLAFKKTT